MTLKPRTNPVTPKPQLSPISQIVSKLPAELAIEVLNELGV
jgi:hypothetical protein